MTQQGDPPQQPLDELQALIARLRSKYVMFTGRPMFSNKGPVLKAADIHEAADTLERQAREIQRLREALAYFVSRERSIKIDIGSAHKARGAAASDFMREDDRDFRQELEAAFIKARAALSSQENKDGR